MNKENEKEVYIKALTTRDPSKRQIKPIDKDTFQLFEDLESESDDDYVADSDDMSEDNEKAESVDNNNNDEEENNNSDTSDSDSEENKSIVSDTKIHMTKKEKSDIKLELEVSNVALSKTKKMSSVMICMMCLLDDTYSDNEIVECDNCGIMVHEDCYKISDSVYMSCDSSDASTDPWFCDACLCGVKYPMCELCPVKGGAFKKTEHNRWVHLICALYTPGVAFNDTENLTEITLSEIPYKEWGNRECTICTESLYAKTGICISCDAGLCKNYFHVLCAQKEGLLSEPNLDENPEDPYFAQCRQHTDKDVAKRRRKHYTAALNCHKLRLELWSEKQHQQSARIVRKLKYFSEAYDKSKHLLPTPFVPSTKVPQYLETSSLAVRLFINKATNLHLPMDIFNSFISSAESKSVTSSGSIPTFSPDFISYFIDRERKIDETNNEIIRLESYHREMQISEQNTSHKFNKLTVKKDEITKNYQEKLSSVLAMYEFIKIYSKDKNTVEKIESIVNKFEPISNGISENDSCQGEIPNDKDPKTESLINECSICKRVNDQHLLIDCDNCRKYFHLNCLDPPLARMPKKTKQYGWQCSNCTPTSEEDKIQENIDVSRPRQLRKSIGNSIANKLKDTATQNRDISSKLNNKNSYGGRIKSKASLTNRVSKNLINEAKRRQTKTTKVVRKSRIKQEKIKNMKDSSSNDESDINECSSNSCSSVSSEDDNCQDKVEDKNSQNSNTNSDDSNNNNENRTNTREHSDRSNINFNDSKMCEKENKSVDNNNKMSDCTNENVIDKCNGNNMATSEINNNDEGNDCLKQRKSNRSRKRPNSLLDEIEGVESIKRRKLAKGIKEHHRMKKRRADNIPTNKSVTHRCITDFFLTISPTNTLQKSSNLSSSLSSTTTSIQNSNNTSTYNNLFEHNVIPNLQESASNDDKGKIKQQPILFYPSTDDEIVSNAVVNSNTNDESTINKVQSNKSTSSSVSEQYHQIGTVISKRQSYHSDGNISLASINNNNNNSSSHNNNNNNNNNIHCKHIDGEFGKKKRIKIKLHNDEDDGDNECKRRYISGSSMSVNSNENNGSSYKENPINSRVE